MAHNFGSLASTPAIKALHGKYGSRRHYARMESGAAARDRLGPEEDAFITERDTFYMATVGAGGWPYVQHRGGAKGLLKVIDDQTIAFADFGGNKQYISTGNLTTEHRVALIVVDSAHQARLRILGRVEILTGETARPWIERLSDPADKPAIERVYALRLEAFDWNCPQHIAPDQVKEALAPLERRLEELELENTKLREAAQSKSEQVG